MGKKADKGFSWSLNEDYVSPKGLKNLRKYKYSGVDNCITTMLLNDYWNWLVNSVIPSYVAPNVLTLCGGLCVLVAYSLCAFSNPYISDSTVSPIILVLSALLIFAYQVNNNKSLTYFVF